MVAKKENEDEGIRKEILLKDVNYEVTKAVIESISEATESILLSEFEKYLKDNDFLLASKDSFMSYVSALALLSLALEEESEENMAKVMTAIGLDFDHRVFSKIPKYYVRNRLVYVYAFYFLVINGRRIDVPEVRAVVEALGVDFDRPTFEESLVLICSNTKCGRITL